MEFIISAERIESINHEKMVRSTKNIRPPTIQIKMTSQSDILLEIAIEVGCHIESGRGESTVGSCLSVECKLGPHGVEYASPRKSI